MITLAVTPSRALALLLLLQISDAKSVVAPRLPESPFPVSKQPENILVYNLTGANFDERVLLMSAVGVVAQTEPILATVDDARLANTVLGQGPGSDHWHLQLLPASKMMWTLGLPALLSRLRNAGYIKGYIMCSSESGPGDDNGSMHIAVGLAGILKAVIVTDSTRKVAEKAGLELVLDIASLTLESAFEMFHNNFSRTLLYNQPHSELAETTDFAVYGKAFALYDSTLTMPLSQRALARLDPISFVLGWASEVDFVTSASRHGHQVLCSDHVVNVPIFMNFALAEDMKPKESRGCPIGHGQHTVAFMFTDGDSITWDLGQFASPDQNWWGQFQERGKVPIAWTFQPVLQELHPYFLRWVAENATHNDILLTGPSGAGYTYLDQYPNSMARKRFANWTTANMMRSPMLNMINQLQVLNYSESFEMELVQQSIPPEALFVDEELTLTIHGAASMLEKTIVTSRRHALSKTFGDLTPSDLVATLNAAPRDPHNAASYSLVGVEVWGYGVTDINDIAAKLDSGVRVVPIDEYVACLRHYVLQPSILV